MTDAQDLNDEQLFDALAKAAESTECYTLATEARNRYLKLKANFKMVSKERDDLEKENRNAGRKH